MEFEIKNRVIRAKDKYLVVGDNADYTAEFEFDAEWNGKTKTARFIRNGNYVDVLIEDDKCTIPVEVLKRGFVTVGVYAAEMATTHDDFIVKESVKEIGGNVAEPTPNIYEQLTGKLDDIQAQLPNEVQTYFNEHKDELKGDKGDTGERGEQGIQGIQGEQGYSPVRNVDYWTAEDQAQVVEDVLTSEEITGAIDTANEASAMAKDTFNSYANALKGAASGEVVRVDDISPVEHTAKVKVAGKNLFDISKVLDTNGITNNGDGTLTISIYGVPSKTLSTICPCLKVGDVVKLSLTSTGLPIINIGGKVLYKGTTFTITQTDLDSVIYFYTKTPSEPSTETVSNIQIEYGDTATEYTPYVEPTSVTVTRYGADETTAETYTPNADGTLEITSIAPTMTLLTDKEGVNIELEYNKDLNIVINDILKRLN